MRWGRVSWRGDVNCHTYGVWYTTHWVLAARVWLPNVVGWMPFCLKKEGWFQKRLKLYMKLKPQVAAGKFKPGVQQEQSEEKCLSEIKCRNGTEDKNWLSTFKESLGGRWKHFWSAQKDCAPITGNGGWEWLPNPGQDYQDCDSGETTMWRSDHTVFDSGEPATSHSLPAVWGGGDLLSV